MYYISLRARDSPPLLFTVRLLAGREGEDAAPSESAIVSNGRVRFCATIIYLECIDDCANAASIRQLTNDEATSV